MTKPVAVVAAHPDDEVLGCGGTIARMANDGHDVHVLLLGDGETSRASSFSDPIDSEAVTARNAAAREACAILGCASVESLELPDNRLDGVNLIDVVKHIEAFLLRFQPETVLTHHFGDLNIDHRVVHEAVLTACRPQLDHPVKKVLFFEVPSSTEWRFSGVVPAFAPNWFVDISSTLETKLEALKAYDTELRAFPHPRSLEAVEALARWRGATVGMTAAEAFALGRVLIGPT